ncbi:unnamed protein product [Urochloa humidicola]
MANDSTPEAGAPASYASAPRRNATASMSSSADGAGSFGRAGTLGRAWTFFAGARPPGRGASIVGPTARPELLLRRVERGRVQGRGGAHKQPGHRRRRKRRGGKEENTVGPTITVPSN